MIRWATPALAAVLSVALPAQGPQAFKLDSGLQCVLLESHERPLIRMELVTPWERSELPPGKEGIAGFLAEAMASGGAAAYNRAAFTRAMDALGLNFGFKARMGAYVWTLVADSHAQEPAMELLVDAVARPAFDGPQVETARKALVRRAAAESPRERAVSRFLWSLADPATLIPPGAAGLDRIEHQDLLDFHRRVVRPEGSTLILYGDLNLTQARQLALMHLGIWGPDDQPPVKPGPSRPGAKAAEPRLLAVFDTGPAAELWAGAPRPQEASGPAVEALLPILLTRASRARFGALGMTFRLPAEGRTPLLIQAKVPQEDHDSLVPGLLAGLLSLRDTGLSREDLACALIQWKAENGALALHPEALVRAQAEGRLRPDLARAVAHVTLPEINQALKDWLTPDRLRFLLLGADAPMLQAAEKAGLLPSAILGPD